MPPKKPIRILIADDHAVVPVGFVSMLSPEEDLEIGGEAEYGEQAVELFRKQLPDVALFDVRMPDISGIEAARRVRETCPEACILMLSTSDLDEEVAQARDAGAAGYLLKTGSQPEAIRTGCQSFLISHQSHPRTSDEPISSPLTRHYLDGTLHFSCCSGKSFAYRASSAGTSFGTM